MLETDLFIELKCMTWMQANIVLYHFSLMLSVASISRLYFHKTGRENAVNTLARETV